MTKQDALDAIEQEAKIIETHDPGISGARILREALAVLRRELSPLVFWAAIAAWYVVLSTLFSGCTTKAPDVRDVPTSRPNVSAPELRRVRAAPPPAPFNCRAYAAALTPWPGPFPSPIFDAASEAQLPDAPEFAERRTRACAVLEARARTGSEGP
jgi:hypothetical protein